MDPHKLAVGRYSEHHEKLHPCPVGGSFFAELLRLQNKEADLVRNARIMSMDEAGTTYTAMAIKDGRILNSGPNTAS